MADNYTVVGQYPDTEYLGGTATRPVTTVQYTTVPSGIYFESRIPDTAYSKTEADNTGKVNAAPLEDLLTLPGVTGVEWTQVSQPTGFLADQIVIYWQTASGASSGSVTTPFSGLSNKVAGPLVATAIAAATEVEAL